MKTLFVTLSANIVIQKCYKLNFIQGKHIHSTLMEGKTKSCQGGETTVADNTQRE